MIPFALVGQVRITRDESVQAIKVTRETSITDRQLSTLQDFEHLLNAAPNGFETERNVQIVEKSEKKVESAPAGDAKVTENNEHSVQVQVSAYLGFNINLVAKYYMTKNTVVSHLPAFTHFKLASIFS